MSSVVEYRGLTDSAAMLRAGLFVAEGRMVVRRLLASSRFRTRSVLVTPVAFEAIRDLVPASLPCHIVHQTAMDALVGFNMHRGCVALAERPNNSTLDQIDLGSVDRVVALEAVSNPDNVGGIFRSAAAFGAELVVLGPGCGDPLYRKAIRTSMAATLEVPFAHASVWPDAIGTLRMHGLRVVALTPGGGATPLDEHRATRRVALLLGQESTGLSTAALAAADDRLRIRMTGRVDSLNVSVAASIAMHHCFATR